MLDKQAKLIDLLFKKEEIDSILLTSMDDIFYLTEFTGSEASVIVSKDGIYFFSDFRYETEANDEVKNAEVLIYKDKFKEIKNFVKTMGLRKIGFEPKSFSYDLYEKYKNGFKTYAELKPLKKGISSLRVLKNNEEIEKIKKAARIAETSFNNTLKLVKEGVSERFLSLRFEFNARKLGAERLSFDTIAASGIRGAMPHGKPSDKLIRKNELITFDFGIVSNGYCSDETVTVSLGKAAKKQKEIYQIVYDAQRYAFEKIKPSVPLKEVDKAARSFIEKKGYGKYFGHGLGHGVGINVHEEPVVSFKSKGICRENMVFTVEPGIYIPNWGGIRIEDMIVVKKGGCEKLTYIRKELKELEVF